MRIRYLLLNAYGGGGTIRTTLSMAGELAARGHDVEVASVTQRRRRPCFAVPRGVRLVSLASPFHPVRGPSRAALAHSRSRFAHPNDRLGSRLTRAHDHWLRRYVEAQDDCVVVGTRMSLNLALAALRTERQVAVAQEHNHLAKAPEVRASYVEAYPALDSLVVLTDGDAARYRALLGDTCRVHVIPNALPQGTRLRRSPLTAPVAVAAGSLIRRKGFDLLVDAWRTVSLTHPDWQLRIYGVGDQADALTEQIAGAGLAGTVTLGGFVPDLASRFDEASVFVLPSRREGMPLVLLEAMAAGLPVVAFDCPTGPAEILDGGRCGLLVVPGDTPALAHALTTLVADGRQRRSLAQAGAERVLDFDLQATARRWESLLADLADRRNLAVGR